MFLGPVGQPAEMALAPGLSILTVPAPEPAQAVTQDLRGIDNGTGDANIQAADGSLWKLYAVSYNATTASEQAIAYRAFDTPLSAAGDGFSLSLELQNANNGVGNPGQIGFALRNGNTTGAGNQGAGARLQVYLAGVTNFAAGGTNYLVVQDASGPQATSITNVGTSAAFDFTVTLTGPNTYSLSITRYTGLGITNPPVVVTGTLAGSGTIDSFAMFSWTTDPSSAVNSDVYFNRLSFTNQAAFTCPTIGLGSVVSPLSGTAYSQVITGSGGLASILLRREQRFIATGSELVFKRHLVRHTHQHWDIHLYRDGHRRGQLHGNQKL